MSAPTLQPNNTNVGTETFSPTTFLQQRPSDIVTAFISHGMIRGHPGSRRATYSTYNSGLRVYGLATGDADSSQNVETDNIPYSVKRDLQLYVRAISNFRQRQEQSKPSIPPPSLWQQISQAGKAVDQAWAGLIDNSVLQQEDDIQDAKNITGFYSSLSRFTDDVKNSGQKYIPILWFESEREADKYQERVMKLTGKGELDDDIKSAIETMITRYLVR